MNIHKIAEFLNNLNNSNESVEFDCQPISGEVDVLQVTIIGREELPIFISVTDDQILCVTYLWGDDEVKANKVSLMHESMLEMNIPMSLSSFSKIANKYVIFGALSISACLKDIEHEIVVLNSNAIEIIEDMSEFLI